MKRFWKEAAVAAGEAGWDIRLDGRPVKTPARAVLSVPTEALAEAIADEWNGVGEKIDPRTMPLSGLANAAIDRIAPDIDNFASGIAKYGETDLLYYRAEGPAALIAEQASAWNPILDWARGRYDCHFTVTHGVSPVAQPQATVTQLRQALASLAPFALAGLASLVTIGGSLIAALAVSAGAISPTDAWRAVTLDERWNAERWGEDSLAAAALENRRKEFLVAAKFLQLVSG